MVMIFYNVTRNHALFIGKEVLRMIFLPTINMEATGARIKELRIASGFSIARLADTLGVSQQAICKWQKGKAIPSIDHCVELSIIFRVPINDFIVTDAPVRARDRFVREDERSSFLP